MQEDRPTSEQIVAHEERTERNIVVLLSSMVLLIGAVALLMLATKANYIPLWLFNGLGTALFLAWLSYMIVRLKPSPSAILINHLDEDYLRKTIDIQQRRNRYSLLLQLVNLFWLGSVLTNALVHFKQKPLVALALALTAAIFAFFAFVAILSLSYGPGFFLPFYRRAVTDEFSRAQRARAAQLGFILAVLEMSAILVAAAYHPHWGVVSLPLAIATAIALPGFYFIYLEWRSDRG